MTVIKIPPSPKHTWDGTDWVLDQEVFTQELTQALKNRRDEWWANQTVTLDNGAILKTNKRTRDDTSDTFNAMTNANMETYSGWNAENGVYEMALSDFQEYSVLALQVVATSFVAYNTVVSNHDQTPYTSIEDAIDDFNSLVGE